MTGVSFTVVVAVYNRTHELRRALISLVNQTIGNFECIVVDDASTMPIEPIVAGFDERFQYVRSEQNRGCTGARFAGYERMQGEYLMHLDSDNELYPWALERASHHLSAVPQVDGVAGLYAFPDGLRARVPDSPHENTPRDYAAGIAGARGKGDRVWDCVGAVRRIVVDEWLLKRRDYYNCDFNLWFTFQLGHSQLFVDEPWGRYHADASDRITKSSDARRLRDPVIFVEEHRPRLGTVPCVPLDRYLANSWFALMRAGHFKEARLVRAWFGERGHANLGAVAAERMRNKVRNTATATLARRSISG